MMTDAAGRLPTWLEVLLLPVEVLVRPAEDGPAAAVRVDAARVVLGHPEQAERLAGAIDIGDAPADDPRARVDQVLLAGLADQVRGRYSEALGRYADGRIRDVDAAAAAAVLSSLALAELDRHGDAITILEQAEARLSASAADAGHEAQPALAWVRVHLGWRHAERGAWSEAIDRTEAAVDAEPVAEVERLLAAVAQLNLGHYRRSIEPSRRRPAQDRPLVRALQGRLERLAGALPDVLDGAVTARFQDPRERRYGDDLADESLWAATFSAELLAYVGAIRTCRRALGRYRILAAAGEAGDASAELFKLLLDADDEGHLGRIASWFVRRGGASGLAAEVTAAAHRPWLLSSEQATFALLSGAGELLAAPDADLAVDRLLDLAESGEQRVGWAMAAQALHATRGPLRAASPALHARAADSVLDILKTGGDGLISHYATSVAGAVRWAETDANRLAQAWALVEQLLAMPSTPHRVVGSLLLGLASRDPQRAAAAARDAFLRRPNAKRAAVLLDLNGDTAELIDRVIDVGRSLVADELAEADEEHPAGGSEVNGAHLLAVALLQRPHPDNGWALLTEWLANVNVLAWDKVPVLDVVARRFGVLPHDVAAALRRVAANGVQGAYWWSEDEVQVLAGPALRFGIASGGLPAGEAGARLLALATSSVELDRIQAMWTIGACSGDLPHQPTTTLALVGAADRHHDVRAAAGRALVPLAAQRLEPEVLDAARRLLQEDGSAAPLGVLAALQDDARDAVPALLPVVRLVAEHHPSSVVRRRAQAAAAAS